MSPHWRFLALLLTFSIAPGAAEAVESVAHIVTVGHLPHASDQASNQASEGHEHQAPEDEHGCNSVFHACACHASVSFVLQIQQRAPQRATAVLIESTSPICGGGTEGADGVTVSILRPPIA